MYAEFGIIFFPFRSIENLARFVASLKHYYWERMSKVGPV